MAAPDHAPPVFSVRGPIARSDLPGLCTRVCALLGEPGQKIVVCDVTGVEPDAVTVDALARLQLAARQHGRRVRLRNASAKLLELVEFMGLADVLLESDPAGERRTHDESRRPATT
jgi:ABC-type transporter Mla MlaB component